MVAPARGGAGAGTKGRCPRGPPRLFWGLQTPRVIQPRGSGGSGGNFPTPMAAGAGEETRQELGALGGSLLSPPKTPRVWATEWGTPETCGAEPLARLLPQFPLPNSHFLRFPFPIFPSHFPRYQSWEGAGRGARTPPRKGKGKNLLGQEPPREGLFLLGTPRNPPRGAFPAGKSPGTSPTPPTDFSCRGRGLWGGPGWAGVPRVPP